MNEREFDKFLELLAADLNQDALNEIEEAEKQLDDIEVPEGLDTATRMMIREIADEQEAAERENRKSEAKCKRRKAFDSIVRIAAIMIICLTAVNFVAMGISEAYRDKVFRIFEFEEQGAETLQHNDGNENLIMRMSKEEWQLIADWDDFWYPMWLPDGFYLAEAVNDERQFLKFCKENALAEISIRVLEKDRLLSYDSDTAIMTDIKVNGYNGQLIQDINHEYMIVVWDNEEAIIEIYLSICNDTEMALKIAKNMVHIQK